MGDILNIPKHRLNCFRAQNKLILVLKMICIAIGHAENDAKNVFLRNKGQVKLSLMFFSYSFH